MDARAGPGIKSSMKIKNNKSPSSSKYKSPLKSKKMYPHNIPSSIYDMSGTTIQKKSLRAPSHLLHHAARCLSVSGFYILNEQKINILSDHIHQYMCRQNRVYFEILRNCLNVAPNINCTNCHNMPKGAG